MMSKKIMISVDDGLLSEIEAYATRMHLNRSASIAVLCSTALQAQKSLNTMDELLKAYREERVLQESKSLDSE